VRRAALLAATGFVALLGQVVLLRELSAALYGNELVLVLALGIWMLGTGAGALVGRAARSDRALEMLLLAGGVLVPVAAVWCRAARPALGAVPGAFLAPAAQLAAIVLTLVPAAFVLGKLFQSAARRMIEEGGTLARAYAAESAGALVAGAGVTLAAAADVSNVQAALSCTMSSAAVAAVLALPGDRRAATAAALAFAAAAALLAVSPALDRRTTGWTHRDLAAARDTPYGRAVMTSRAGQIAVFQDDVLDFETQGTATEEFAHLAALQHPSPERVLVRGAAAPAWAAALRAHGAERIETVEIDRALHDLVARALADAHAAAAAEPAAAAPEPAGTAKSAAAAGTPIAASETVTFDDPRRFVRRASAERAGYDLVVLATPEPASGRTNRLYTREFFAECAAILRGGGVLALRLPSAENYWTPSLVRRAAAVERALRASFPRIETLPAASLYLFASDAELPEAAALVARRAERGIDSPVVSEPLVRYLYGNDRRASLAEAIADAKVPANADGRPVCYPYSLMIWLSKFHPALAGVDPLGASSGAARAVALLAAVALTATGLVARRSRARAAIVVAFAAAAGMLLDAVLLLGYQSHRGVLYQHLGLLLAVFMLGLACGAAAVPSLARRARGTRVVLLAALAALAAISALVAASFGAGALPGLATAAAGLVAAGAFVAAVFAAAGLGARDAASSAGRLYAADLAGGAAGSIAALVAIPLLGLAGAALAAAVLALVAAAWT